MPIDRVSTVMIIICTLQKKTKKKFILFEYIFISFPIIRNGMKNIPILSKNISNTLSRMESRLKRAIVITFDEPRESYLKKTLRNGRRTS